MKKGTQAYLESLFLRYPELLQCRSSIEEAFFRLYDCFVCGGKVLLCGNGGSAADCEHISGELLKKFVLSRPIPDELKRKVCEYGGEDVEYLLQHLHYALPALPLCGNNAFFTAFSNDEAFDLVFAQQVIAYGKQNDCLLGITTSGKSANVVYAVRVAAAMGLSSIILCGKNGFLMQDKNVIVISVPEIATYRVQELHLPIYHTLCLMLENECFGGHDDEAVGV